MQAWRPCPPCRPVRGSETFFSLPSRHWRAGLPYDAPCRGWRPIPEAGTGEVPGTGASRTRGFPAKPAGPACLPALQPRVNLSSFLRPYSPGNR